MKNTTMTLTIPAKTGIRLALVLLWESIVAYVRGTTVTFEAHSER